MTMDQAADPTDLKAKNVDEAKGTGNARDSKSATDMTDMEKTENAKETGNVDTVGTRFAGTFTLDSWDQRDDDSRAGSTLSRTRVAKTFGGDLVGTSATDLLLLSTDSGSRAYCGFEHVTGTVAGRTGSFDLTHAAQGDADGGWMTWQVVSGSGTGELSGIRGEGQIVRREDASHSYTLDLSFA